MHGAVFGQPMALAAQFLQFLGAERVTQQRIGIARGVEAGADPGLQHPRTQARLPQDLRDRLHGGAVQRDVAQDQRMGANFPRLRQQLRHGVVGSVAIEQRRAERAIGIGVCQSRQRDLAGAPQRNRRHQADQARRAVGCERGMAPCAQRGDAGAAFGKSVHRQFPAGQIIAVGLDGAFGKLAPPARSDRGEGCERIAVGRSRFRRRAHADDISLQRCATNRRRIRDLDHVPVSPFAMDPRRRASSSASSIALPGKR